MIQALPVVVALAILALVLTLALRSPPDEEPGPDHDELASLFSQDSAGERLNLRASAELSAQRAIAADLEARLWETRVRIALLEEGQVGPTQRR
jgi:hypothetical protein